MKKRIVKIALGQFASIHGETQQNLNKMLTMTDQAAESGADLIVFPELAYGRRCAGESSWVVQLEE